MKKIISCIILCLALCTFLLQTEVFCEFLKSKLEKTVSEKLGQPVTIETLSYKFPFIVELNNINLPYIKAGRLEVLFADPKNISVFVEKIEVNGSPFADIEGSFNLQSNDFKICSLGDETSFLMLSSKGIFSGNGRFSKDGIILPVDIAGSIDEGLFLSSQLDAAALNPYLPGTVVSGPLALNAKITEEGLKLNGKFMKGRVEHLFSEARIENLSFEIEGDHSKLHIHNLKGDDGKKGSVEGKGEVEFNSNLPFTLELALNKLHLVRKERSKASFSGNLLLEGNLEGGMLSGKASLDQGKVSTKEAHHQSPIFLDVTYINGDKEQKSASCVWPLKLDLAVNVPKTLEIKGKGFKSTWSGEILIGGDVQSPSLQGMLEATSGTFNLSGKELIMSEGIIAFAGNPVEKTTLYIIMQVEVEEKKIEVLVRGAVKDPSIAFRSNPSMNQKEILSWLLFNRGTSNISANESFEIAQVLTNLGTSSSSGPLAKIQRAIGVDKIDISSSASGTTKVQVGKYITKYTLISVSRNFNRDPNFGTGANQVGIEMGIIENLKFQAEVSDESTGQINLIWKKDY